MSIRSLALAFLVALLLCSGSLFGGTGSNAPKLIKRGKHYYINYELSVGRLASRDAMTPFQDGGQFELRIYKSEFPVPAPHCTGNIILRMPWTDPALSEARAKVEQKRKLYDRINGMSAGSKESVRVTIDLAPYVRETSREPLKVELTGCNVFFMQEAGAYVPEPLTDK